MMKKELIWKTMHFIITIISLICFGCSNQPDKSEEIWIDLFNGQNLDGWKIKINKHLLNENYKNTFQVKDSLLIVNYSEYDTFDQEFGHIYFDKPFSKYKLKLEYRFTGKQVAGGPGWAFKNSGIMFHSQSPESVLVDQPFPVCIEAQFLGGSEQGERPTGNVCTPGTHIIMNGSMVTDHCISSVSPTYRGEEWIQAELLVYGDSIIHHIIQGDTVLSYSKPQIGGDLPPGFPLSEGTTVRDGYIALQAESHPVEFRRIKLLDLSGKMK